MNTSFWGAGRAKPTEKRLMTHRGYSTTQRYYLDAEPLLSQTAAKSNVAVFVLERAG